MGKKGEFIVKTFRWPKEIDEELGNVAVKSDISINRFAYLCIVFALKKLRDSEDTLQELLDIHKDIY